MKIPGSDNEWYEDLGHVGLGLLPFDLLLWMREWTKVKLFWPLSGQFPPGRTIDLGGRKYAPLDRVRDVGVDTLGYDIGRTIRTAVLIGLLIWRW